jgi:hypothetical protein
MKTLVIHPKDSTTHFLDIVYRNIDDLTLITGGVSKDYVMEQIKTHDRVMMMGHGSPGGLFAVGQFDQTRGFIIDHECVELLKEKDNSVFIWCNADQFVERYDLKGFYTGMFISEVGEAMYCGLPETEQPEVDESNYSFVEIMGECIDHDPKTIHFVAKERYGKLVDHNPVAKYNHERLYVNF